MADKAYITPNVLKWARESARVSAEDAAKKVNVSAEKLLTWEDGTAQPTIKQAETLAKAYRRPFALFFLPDVPRDFMPLQDYRKPNSTPLGTGSIFIIREIQQKQAWISEVYADNDEKKLPFVGKYTINANPVAVAEDILQTLGIDPLHYVADNPIKNWIDRAEAKGIFISRTSFLHSRLTLDSDELQGFAIADAYAPFVFINSDDWNAPQLFTLVHELAHIWIASSGISNDIQPEMAHRDRMNPIELFCNEVAAAALMPTHIMRAADAATFETAANAFKFARKLGVSSFAFIVRALNLQLITLPKYNALKAAADADFKSFLKREEEKKAKQKEQEGGPNPYLLRLQKNSRLFTQVVLDAFKGGIIEATLASSLLNTPINNFPKLENLLYK